MSDTTNPLVSPKTSDLSQPLPIVYGRCILPAVCVHHDFGSGHFTYLSTTSNGQGRMVPVSQSDGTTAWNYVSDGYAADVAVYALCQAPITGVVGAWANDVYYSGSDMKYLTMFWNPSRYPDTHGAYGWTTGTNQPMPTSLKNWFNGGTYGYLSGVEWRGVSYFYATKFIADNPNPPPRALKFVVDGRCISSLSNTSIYGAEPADVIVDLLTDPSLKIGLNASLIDVQSGIDGNAASGYRTYCRAHGWLVNRALSEREDALSLIQSLLDETNSQAVWSNGKLTIVPLGDTSKTSGSYFYTPPNYSILIDENEIKRESGDPITVVRRAEEEVFNCFPVQTRISSTNDEKANYEFIDEAHSQRWGVRRASLYEAKWCSTPSHAMNISQLKTWDSLYRRNSYRFKLGPRWTALQPTDIITLSEPISGLSGSTVRIVSIDERTDGSIEVEARDWPIGSARVLDLTPQSYDGLISSSWSDNDSGRNPWWVSSGTVVTAGDSLFVIGSDNWLSKGEKSEAILELTRLESEVLRAREVADNLTPPLDYSGYCPYYYDNLITYLGTITPAWSDVTTDSPITGTDWRYSWSAAWAMVDRLRKNITANAQSTAYAAQDSANIAFDSATIAFSSASAAFAYADVAFNSASHAQSTANIAFSSASTAFDLALKGGGGGNLFYNSNFQTGSANVPTGWMTYNNTFGLEPSTVTLFTAGGPFGGPYFRNAWSVNNTSQKGIYYWPPSADGISMANRMRVWQPYILSFYARASGTNIGQLMSPQWNNGPNYTYDGFLNPPLTSEWQRYAWKLMWTTGWTIDSACGYISIAGNSLTQGHLDIACPQMSEGAALGGWIPNSSELLPSSITTTMISPLAITSPLISAGAIQGTHISASTIQGTHISASTITTNLLKVGANSAISDDPWFDDATAWSFTGSAIFQSAAGLPAGTNYVLTNAATQAYVWGSKFYPVDHTKQYQTRFWAWGSDSNARACYVGMQVLDGAKANVTSSAGTYWYNAYSGNVTNVGLQEFSGNVGPGTSWVLPANAMWMRPIALLNWFGAAGQIGMTGLRIEELVRGDLIVNGTIQGTHISASTIQGTHIAAGTISGTNIAGTTIEGTHIKALTISGTHIAAGTLSASHIAAREIRTSDYAYSGTPNTNTEVALTGAIMRAGQSTSNGSIPAIITSAAGIKIGKKTLDQAWFGASQVASLAFSQNGASTFTYYARSPNVGNITTNSTFLYIPIASASNGAAVTCMSVNRTDNVRHMLVPDATLMTSGSAVVLRCLFTVNGVGTNPNTTAYQFDTFIHVYGSEI